MEVRVYRSINDYSANKYLYCFRIQSPDVFSFKDCLSVFKSIFGFDVIIVFVCV